MKSSSMLKTLGVMLALATVASAEPLTWTHQISGDPYGNPIKFLKDSGNSSNSYASGWFDLTTDGFDADTMTISSAIASFAFADDSANTWYGSETDSDEYVDIYINSLTLIDDQEVDGSHPSSSFAWYSESLNGTMLLALQDDGKISWKVQLQNTSGTNDVYLKVAKLVANGSTNEVPPPPPPPTSVPDEGATSLLLAVAFAGLIALRKRFRHSA